MANQTLSRNQESDCASLLDAAFEFGLTPSEFKVYYCLMRSSCTNRTSKLTIEKLTLQCKLGSRNTVKRALEALIQMGMVRRLEARNCYVHQLTEPLDWVKRSMDQKLNHQKLSAQFLSGQKEIDVEQPKSSNNPIGVIADLVVPCEQQDLQKLTPSKTDLEVDARGRGACDISHLCRDRENLTHQNSPSPISNSGYETEPELDNLNSKIAAARILGCNVGLCWEKEEMFVRIDGALKTVAQFKELSLLQFKQSIQPCQDGMDLCRATIEKIKQRLKNQKLTRLEQLSASG